MAVISFWKHERYPGLNIEIGVEPALTSMHQTAKVSLIAQGEPADLVPLNDDMSLWEDRHRLAAHVKQIYTKGMRYEYQLKSWNVLADFIVVWVGISNLNDLLQDRQFVERQIFGEVRALSVLMETLITKIDRLEFSMKRSTT